jgi:hypothetical protein
MRGFAPFAEMGTRGAEETAAIEASLICARHGWVDLEAGSISQTVKREGHLRAATGQTTIGSSRLSPDTYLTPGRVVAKRLPFLFSL